MLVFASLVDGTGSVAYNGADGAPTTSTLATATFVVDIVIVDGGGVTFFCRPFAEREGKRSIETIFPLKQYNFSQLDQATPGTWATTDRLLQANS
jgi:hypothetical protein